MNDPEAPLNPVPNMPLLQVGSEAASGSVQTTSRDEAPSEVVRDENPQQTASAAEATIDGALRRKDYWQATLLFASHYGPGLSRVCLSLVNNSALAEDLTQEVLLEAHSALPKWERKGSARAYIFAIARRRCARALELELGHAAKLEALSHETSDHEELSLQKERAVLARKALAELKPSLREAVVLRFIAELSFAELAQSLGVDEPAARQRVSRGLRALRAAISEETSP